MGQGFSLGAMRTKRPFPHPLQSSPAPPCSPAPQTPPASAVLSSPSCLLLHVQIGHLSKWLLGGLPGRTRRKPSVVCRGWSCGQTDAGRTCRFFFASSPSPGGPSTPGALRAWPPQSYTQSLSLTWRCSLSPFLFPRPVPPVPICQGQEAPLTLSGWRLTFPSSWRHRSPI